MDIKIEPVEEILPPRSSEETIFAQCPDNNFGNRWNDVSFTDHRSDICVKQERCEDDVCRNDGNRDCFKQINQNDEQSFKIESEADGIGLESSENDVYKYEFPIKKETLDYGECSYAETTTDESKPVKNENSQDIAVITLKKVVFYERNFVCNICFSILDSPSSLSEHKKNHINIEYKSVQEIPIEYNEPGNCKVKKNNKQRSIQKRFKCNQCDYSSAHSYSLKTHTMIHTGEKPYKCDQCDYRTAYSFHLKSHKLSHSTEKTLKCDLCNFTSAHFNSLKRHKIIHSGIKPFKCDQCNYRATSSFLLRKHKTSHSDEKPFKCDNCDFTCANSSNLKRHNMIHSGEKPFKCDECQFKTIYSFHFKMHKLLHTGQKPYRCDLCDYKTIHPMYLKAHKATNNCVKPLKIVKNEEIASEQSNRVVIKQELIEEKQNPTTKQFCCIRVMECLKMPKDEALHITVKAEPPIATNPKSIMVLKTVEKPFKCNQCEYKTAKSADLKRHEKIHSADRPWKCDLCDYASANSSNLKTHRMVHSGEKPFKCDQCDFKSVRSSDLKRHKMLHSGEKPHHCHLCSYKTAYHTDLKKHKLTHFKSVGV